MNAKENIHRLQGKIQDYAWGGTTYISSLLGKPGGRAAEYWLGAHDLAPSQLMNGDVASDLGTLISSDPEGYLGKTVAKKFGRLPYLLKVMDVKDMLSIQVHPAKHEAEIEFARENKEGIPLNSPKRNYKDDNHKPEMFVAISEFWTLHGFKPVDQLQKTLQSIPEFKPLLDIFTITGYDQLYKTVMEMPQESVNNLLSPLLERVVPKYENQQLTKQQEDFWAARAALTYNRDKMIDRGIFSIYFFNLLCIPPGKGLFQDAGLPHAYLEGQNIELMANSDNVLRGGLTPKHVDVKELMKHVKFEETHPNILEAEDAGNKEKMYRTGAPDFKLSRYQLNKNETSSFESASGEILLVLQGKVLVDSQELTKGEAVFVGAYQQVALKALEPADIYKASVPVHHE